MMSATAAAPARMMYERFIIQTVYQGKGAVSCRALLPVYTSTTYSVSRGGEHLLARRDRRTCLWSGGAIAGRRGSAGGDETVLALPLFECRFGGWTEESCWGRETLVCVVEDLLNSGDGGTGGAA